MKDIGVSGFRVLPVEPSPRWRQTVPEETISDVEWQAWLPDLSHVSHMFDRIPVCSDAWNMPFIDADGRLLLCNALSGITEAYGFTWDNVYEKPLQQLFTDSVFLDCLKCTCGDLKKRNPECQNCEWKMTCGMGCRAEALAHGNSIYDIDRRMCHFFKDGIFDQVVAIADQYHLKRILKVESQ